MNKKYQEYVELYNNTFKYFESSEPTESYELNNKSVLLTKCPSRIPTIIPTNIQINKKKYDKNDTNIELIIIILPTLFFVIIIFFIAFKFKQLKHRMKIKYKNKMINNNENDNFGTTIDETINF
jgi:hypothetical protein